MSFTLCEINVVLVPLLSDVFEFSFAELLLTNPASSAFVDTKTLLAQECNKDCLMLRIETFLL